MSQVVRVSPHVLFENIHVLAVDKPAGWLSVPSRMGSADPRPCLGIHLEEQTGARLWPIHRLDEDVTGVILFAKSAAAHKRANAWFESRALHKTYEAWTEAPSDLPPKGRQVWESHLLRGKKRAYESPQGKASKTEAECRGYERFSGREVLAWHLFPVTGRPHQLRFELARHGFPILGDELYGAKESFVGEAIALRCICLDFSAVADAAALELPPSLSASPLAEYVATETPP